MEPFIDHIEITVRDMAVAGPFYDRLLPLLGYDLANRTEAVIEHQHVAFRAGSRAEVDRLHRELQAIGATIVSPPREYPEYTPAGYYALYFKDLEGIKYAIVCTAADNGQK